MKNINTLLYVISLVLAIISGACALNASLLAMVICNAGIIIVVIILMIRTAHENRKIAYKDAFKQYLFDYDDFYELYYEKSYEELTDILIKKGGFNYDSSDLSDKPIELALINRLAYLKWLEKEG